MRRPAFFRGTEFSRLLLLAGVMIAGWLLVVVGLNQSRRPAPARRVARAAEPLPPPVDAPEFEGILDKTPMSPRDNPAYLSLLRRVRETPASKLAAGSRNDVVFSQLIERPARYRGLPIHLEGTALRILHQDATGSKLFPEGEFFEAYVITPDSQNYPYILVFESAAPDLPVCDNIRLHVAFDGYFFKLMAYVAGDATRFAPVLVGRLQWLDQPGKGAGAGADGGWITNRWVWLGFALLLVFMALRWLSYLRGTFGGRVRRPRSGQPRTDQIEPEELSAWIETQEEGESGEDWKAGSDQEWR